MFWRCSEPHLSSFLSRKPRETFFPFLAGETGGPLHTAEREYK